MNPVPSDETLHAFVDGELDVAESEILTARMRDDPKLAERVCALRSLRSMVRLSYACPPVVVSRARRTSDRGQQIRRGAMVCLVLFAGLSGGWALRGLESRIITSDAPARVADGYQTVSLAREADPNRVVLHLDSAASERMLAVLEHADRLLDEAERQGRLMQLEVVVNSHGIDLLRAGVTPYAARIARMTQRHANLQWVACSQSIARFTGEGQKVELLPIARTKPTAIGEIVSRLQQGWTYVRV